MKIGVFDSGVGGLTVLREIAQAFPADELLYLGDTARLPYGTKSAATIRKYSEQVMNFLITRQVDAIVIACNTASSQVWETSWKGVPVFNVIDPGARSAVKKSAGKKIGVLGTRATIESESYVKRIKAIDESFTVFSQSCPLLVPLAEEGWMEDPVTDLVIARYLAPLRERKVDTLILGCTHYPILKSAIARACGNEVSLVESGAAICEALRAHFPKSTGAAGGHIGFYATDLSPHTRALAERIMRPTPIGKFEVVHL